MRAGQDGGRIRAVTVGVLSDTHGHLYPEVRDALAGVDHIIHAGDIGSAEVLAALRALAPVTAVRGNCDLGAWARSLPGTAKVEIGGVPILVRHIPRALGGAGGKPITNGCAVVISGHTHAPAIERLGEILYVNPGSAGPRRWGRPRTIARLSIRPLAPEDQQSAAGVAPEIVIVSGHD